MKKLDPRVKVYAALQDVTKFHFAPLEEGPDGRRFPKNLVLMALDFLLGRNLMVIGAPGWGKTTGVKSIISRLTPNFLNKFLTGNLRMGTFLVSELRKTTLND
ncbi:hypothetical protein HZC08_01385 [Candidatus Micrarchaeota archaeon]|nr:hypothetical protein [Candidatus Micrarchaeota archaeon]